MMLFQVFASRRLPLGAISCSGVFIALSCFAHAQNLSANITPSASTTASSTVGVTQASPAKPSPETGPSGGWNFSFNENLQHDSNTGWSDIVTPDLSLRPNRHSALDANVAWYPALAAYVTTTVNGISTTTLTETHNVLGDTAVAAHAVASKGDFDFTAGAAVGFPTGDQSLGVSAGKTTYHFGMRSEYSIGHFTPGAEAGIGNSSAFANQVVRKSYTAVGEIANFQAGTNVDLPAKLSLDVEAYEAMPVQPASIFGTISRRGTHGGSHGRQTLLGSSGSAEDNGITTELGVPLARRLAIAANYNHSLIQADDIVGISLTWVLRTPRNADARTPASPISH